MKVALLSEPRWYIMWFVDKPFQSDFSKIIEIFINIIYNISKVNIHLYTIVDQELGYEVSLDYMLMKIHPKEDIKFNKHNDEVLQCNHNFYLTAKELDLNPDFVHIDKDWSEISVAQIFLSISIETMSISEQFEKGVYLVTML